MIESIADTLSIQGTEGKLEKEGIAIWNMLQTLSDEEISQSVRQHVADALGKTGLPYLAPRLFEILTILKTGNDADIDICMHIADALGALGNISVVDDLLKMLAARDIPSRLHMRIIDALGFLGKTCSSTRVQDILSRLRKLLSNSSIDADVRGHAAIALGRIGEQFSKEVLDLLINSKVDTYIRKSITIAIGESINQAYVPILLGLLENQEEELDLRILAADALSSMGGYSDPPQLSPNLRAELLFRLQAILLQPNLDASVGGSIVDALSKLGERSIASSLLPLLSSGNLNLHIRGHIALALTQLGEQSAVPQIVEYLVENNLDPHLRWMIAKGIENVGINTRARHQTVSTLASFLRKESGIDRDVRRHIAHTLGQLADDEETVHELSEQFLKSDIPDDIHYALWTISRRAKTSLFITETPAGKHIKVIKWQAYE